jgi:hypothetical protein
VSAEGQDSTPTLDELPPRGRQIVLAYVESVYAAGIAEGRQQAEDEQRGRGAVSAAVAQMIAGTLPYADLADRRGQPERAARQRAILAARGVTP